jgi:hypothetical protein
MNEQDRMDMRETWADQLGNAVEEVAPEAHRDEMFDVYLLAFGADFDLEFMRGMTEDQFIRLRDAARQIFETSSIETAHVREAVEAFVWHWSG